uniref:Uncharacterized protein n=1 Tax=Pipistrellus kuhlii TaxID=59472 RepID=A0A7J7UGK2_PIPKU|nr:hypothetical protein mPipKuh1_009108 [Pipistrellus kuhlii]
MGPQNISQVRKQGPPACASAQLSWPALALPPRRKPAQLAWLLGIFSFRSSPYTTLELGPNQTCSMLAGAGFCQPLGQAGVGGRAGGQAGGLGPVSAVLPGPRRGWTDSPFLSPSSQSCVRCVFCHKLKLQPRFSDGKWKLRSEDFEDSREPSHRPVC